MNEMTWTNSPKIATVMGRLAGGADSGKLGGHQPAPTATYASPVKTYSTAKIDEKTVVHPKNETRKIGDSFSRRGTDDEAPGVSDSIEAGCGGALGGRGERHRGSAGSAVAGPAFVCVAGQGSTEWVGGVAWMGTAAQGGNGGGGPGGGRGGGRGRAGGCAAAGRRAGA